MRAYLLPLGTAVLWGLNYHFAKRMVAEAHFVEVGFWRYVLAVTVLAAVGWRTLPPWREVRAQLPAIFRIGSLALLGFNLGYFLGLRTTSALNASLIMALNPATTVLLSAAWLGTQVRVAQVVGLVISLAGVAYLIFDGNLEALLALEVNAGDLFILGANACFAVHHVLVKRDGGVLPNRAFTLLINLAVLLSFVALLPVFAVRRAEEGARVAGDFAFAMLPTLAHGSEFWMSAVGFGAFGTALAYLLWNAGVAKLGADTSALFLNVAPVATALGAVALGEPLYAKHLVSGALVIGGMLVAQRGGVR